MDGGSEDARDRAETITSPVASVFVLIAISYLLRKGALPGTPNRGWGIHTLVSQQDACAAGWSRACAGKANAFTPGIHTRRMDVNPTGYAAGTPNRG
eukprot:6342400-Prymnesium_polylepis.1